MRAVLTQLLDGNLAEVDGFGKEIRRLGCVSAAKYNFIMCDLVYSFLKLMNPYDCF